MVTFFDYQILANRFVLKLKLCKNSSAIFPIDILLVVMGSEEIVCLLGQYPHLNTTCVPTPALNLQANTFIWHLGMSKKSQC